MCHREWETIDHELDDPFAGGSVISDSDTADPLGLGGTPECVHYWLRKILMLIVNSLRGINPETSSHSCPFW